MKLDLEKIPEEIRGLKTLKWDKIKIKSDEISETHGLGRPRQDGWPEDLIKTAWRMVKTCILEDGIGLAAPQVGIFKRMMICRDFHGDGWFYSFAPAYQLYLNPSFEPVTKEGKVADLEYCLSVPEKGYKITRWKVINVTWQEFSKTGKLVNKTAKIQGFPARLFQHEYDHLNGISIPQRWELQNKKQTKTKRKRKKK